MRNIDFKTAIQTGDAAALRSLLAEGPKRPLTVGRGLMYNLCTEISQ